MSAAHAVAGVVLAAGGGARLGRAKAGIQLDGELLVERAFRTLDAAGCTPTIVVLGADADQIRARAALGAAAVVVNPQWVSGIGSSLTGGLRHAAAFPAEAAVVALVDQPLITSAAVARLIEVWERRRGAVTATFHGQTCPPVVLDRSIWDEVIAAARGDLGARPWLRANPDAVTEVACDDVAAGDDIDTEEDLQRLIQQERTWS